MTDEFTQRLTLSRHATDRRADMRTRPALLDELATDARTRVIVLHQGKALVDGRQLITLNMDQLSSLTPSENQEIIFLGISTSEAPNEPVGTPFLAVTVDDSAAAVLGPDAANWGDLRVLGHQLSDRDAGLFTQALALANWHQTHAHSPITGEKTVPGQAGWVRHLADDESAQVFPRTDPAVIVLVTDDQDRLLLGNNAMWESNRFSLLAGYVEPGESLEAAVIREVFEESGVVVVNPVYLGSQPWPFPQSLMLGFRAQVAVGFNPENHVADGEEILTLRWFTRDELKSSLNEIVLPGRVSIARALIEEWLGESLDQEDAWVGRPA
jgi:NAD+ diphosphatase